jgi:hypothetical protein
VLLLLAPGAPAVALAAGAGAERADAAAPMSEDEQRKQARAHTLPPPPAPVHTRLGAAAAGADAEDRLNRPGTEMRVHCAVPAPYQQRALWLRPMSCRHAGHGAHWQRPGVLVVEAIRSAAHPWGALGAQVVATLVSEIVLCVKEVNIKTRAAAYALLVGLARAMHAVDPPPAPALPALDAGGDVAMGALPACVATMVRALRSPEGFL